MHDPKDWPLVRLLAFALLALILGPLWSSIYEEWLRHTMEALGVPVKLLVENVPPLFTAWLIASVVYWYLRHEFERELKRLTTPKFNASFATDIPGCKVATTFGGQMPADYYRIKVEVEQFGQLSGCQGAIASITKDGDLLTAGEVLTLTFAPANNPDSTSKTIHRGKPAFLDVLAITQANQIIITTPGFFYPNSIDPSGLFAANGDYEIKIVITAHETSAEELILVLSWAGQRSSANMRQVRFS